MRSPRHKRRIFVVRALFFCIFMVLWIRLYIIQIAHHKFYAHYAHSQYMTTFTEVPPRALIYDITGKLLALNKPRPAAFIVPSKIKSDSPVLSFLQKNFPHAYERYQKNPHAPFMYVKRKLTPQELELINNTPFEGLYMSEEPERYFTYTCLAPVIGLTGIDNNGLSGLELTYDEQLSGSKSTYLLEREARKRGFYFKKTLMHEGTIGKPVHTTIDALLQFLTFEEVKETVHEFGSKEGAALIVDPTTGNILTCVNYPCCDYEKGEESDLNKNRVLTDVHEFGSVMKIFPALAALEEKLVSADEIIDCENIKNGYLQGIKISTWKAHGPLSYVDVIAQSNNIGSSKVAQRLGTKLYDHLQRCGFGKKTGINFPGEVAGFINPPQKWTAQSPFSLSFGYEISATLLQLAQAFCMIANDGYMVRPRFSLQEEIITSQTPLYSPETLAVIKKILSKTITEGTAHQAALPGYEVYGKTGTANMLVNGCYDRNCNIFTFAAIIKKGDYKRVIITFINQANRKNIYSSSVTVPLFQKIAQKMLIHDKML